MKFDHLSDYIAYLLSKGELILKKTSALESLGKSDAAMRNSIKRHVAKKNLIPLFRGYYLIISPEYATLGFVPPELFIDDLMREIGVPYYIGLLSAASFHGASHQAVQVFQVMANKRLKPIFLGRTKVVFYYNKALQEVSTQQLKTDRGPLTISTPEATAFDLLKYFHRAGNLSHIATILKELGEVLHKTKLKGLLEAYPFSCAQRLGYLLDLTGHDAITEGLAKVIKERNLPFIVLRPSHNIRSFEKNLKWHLFINERIETDL